MEEAWTAAGDTVDFGRRRVYIGGGNAGRESQDAGCSMLTQSQVVDSDGRGTRNKEGGQGKWGYILLMSKM